MTREDILRRIAELDNEINHILGNTQLPSLESRSFPMGTWIFAALLAGYYLFGADIPMIDRFHQPYGRYFFYASGLFAVLALWGSLSWLFRKRGGVSKEYGEASVRVKGLQDQRRELQAQLKELES
jgi:hypothetical protein